MIRAIQAQSERVGTLELARREIGIARADFPSSSVLAALSGRIAYSARDFTTAIRECDEGIVLERYLFLNHLFKGHALTAIHDYEASVDSFQRACDLTNRSPVCLAEIGRVRGVQGRREDALSILREVQASRGYVSPFLPAEIYLGLGEIDEMFC